MDSASFAQLARQLVGVSQTFSKEQTQQASKVLEIIKSYLKVKATHLLGSAGRQPVMFIYSGDGTPVRTKFQKRLPADTLKGQAETVHRSGFQGREFYLQR
eukprot:8593761-Karenia_brevis.AAC.1